MSPRVSSLAFALFDRTRAPGVKVRCAKGVDAVAADDDRSSPDMRGGRGVTPKRYESLGLLELDMTSTRFLFNL